MHQPHALRLATWARFIVLSLLLGVSVLASLGLSGRTAHAQPTKTLTVTNCNNDTQLQADVITANSDNANDTITFACSGDIPLTSTLTITASMTLDGSGQQVTLDGQDQVRGFNVNSGVSFTLKALTIAHAAPSFSCSECGGGGGSFFNAGGTVSISNSTFANNSTTITGNSAAAFGGGIFSEGGTLRINNSTFANNSVTVTGSSGTAFGGGLISFGGTVSITNSTFANNSVSASDFAGGGGLDIGSGTMNITNSTFVNNSATAGKGGGLLNEGTVSISNSIVANNTGGNCSGGVSDQGYNLESGSDCGFTGTGDLQNTDPKLDPSGLQNNGGPTQTIALLSTSPAIDQIPAASCSATDQRGVSRPDNGETTCDMGAYEFTDPVDHDLGLSGLPANMTVDAISPHGAVVTYTPPTATDESGDTPGPSVSCSPASGATFAIGTTTVTCTATDSDDTNSPVSQSFTVTVKGAAAQVSDLINTVNSFHLSSSLQTALDNKLQDVLVAIKAGQTATACSELTDFTGFVQSHIGKGLTVSQANQLIASAKQVQAVLGC